MDEEKNECFRRKTDVSIAELRQDVMELKKSNEMLHGDVRGIISSVAETQIWVQNNAQVTRDVRDILSSFRMISNTSKWVVTVSAAIAVAYGSLKGWFVR